MRRLPKHNRISCVLVAILMALCLLLSGCGEQEVVDRIFALNTYITFTVTGRRAEEAVTALRAEVTRLERLFSTTVETSDVARANASDGAPVTISEETASLLTTAFAVSAETDGAFDVTVRPLVTLWDFEGNPSVPAEEDLAAALALVGQEHVTLTGTEITIDPGSGIDLGGIAKGYVTDRLRDILTEYGIRSAMLVLGGNCYAHGLKPDGSKWRIGIQDPEDASATIGSVRVSDCAVITSGGYQRNFVEDGREYHHILDPETGYPAESGFLSVTILSPDGTLADALSTALFVMGPEKAEAYWRTRDDFEFVAVLTDGSIVVTDGVDFIPGDGTAATTVLSR